MVGPDGLLCAPLEVARALVRFAYRRSSARLSLVARTNPSLVRATITYHNKNLPQGEVFIMVRLS